MPLTTFSSIYCFFVFILAHRFHFCRFSILSFFFFFLPPRFKSRVSSAQRQASLSSGKRGGGEKNRDILLSPPDLALCFSQSVPRSRAKRRGKSHSQAKRGGLLLLLLFLPPNQLPPQTPPPSPPLQSANQPCPIFALPLLPSLPPSRIAVAKKPSFSFSSFFLSTREGDGEEDEGRGGENMSSSKVQNFPTCPLPSSPKKESLLTQGSTI